MWVSEGVEMSMCERIKNKEGVARWRRSGGKGLEMVGARHGMDLSRAQ